MKSIIETILSFFNRILSKDCCNFNFNWSTMRWARKQCEIFESTNIEIIRSFAFTLKRNHVFDIRKLWKFKQNNFIKSLRIWTHCSYDFFCRMSNIQNLNVFKLISFIDLSIWFDECIFISTNNSLKFDDNINKLSIKSDFFESLNYLNLYDFRYFSTRFLL